MCYMFAINELDDIQYEEIRARISLIDVWPWSRVITLQ